MTEIADAKLALLKLHDELLQENPSAAASLVEGLDETLTILEFRLPLRLLRSLSSTNGIESSFSVVERICDQVKRWQGSDHRLRWVASALLFVESRWNKLQGYRQMPVLVNALFHAHKLRLRQLESTRQPSVPSRKRKVASAVFRSPTFNGKPDILPNGVDPPARLGAYKIGVPPKLAICAVPHSSFA